MKRVKFRTKEDQRAFFISVKKKLGLGARRLSKSLDLPSRGPIENYTLMRTAPPLSMVRQLEKISAISAKYEIIEGKVYRNKRKFMPMPLNEAIFKLKKKFGEDYDFLIKLINSKKSIREIMNIIRSKGYSFDNSIISRAIGTYRTNIRSRFVKECNITKEDIVLSGYMNKSKKTSYISFYLDILTKILKDTSIKVGLEISQDRKQVRLFPLAIGRKIHLSNNSLRVLITDKSGLKYKSKIKLILRPKDFGFDVLDSILDKEGRTLAKIAVESGFNLNPLRSTYQNYLGDLSLMKDNKLIIIEITKGCSNPISKYKLGQCLIQTNTYPDAHHFLICSQQLFSKVEKKLLKNMDVNLINSDFKEKWEIAALKEITEGIKK